MKKKEIPPQPERIGVRPIEITEELTESYISYAMSVIVSRALPDVRDGLKPVQRRILWAMWDTGLTHEAKLKKSANVVGEVLGKYHPHGDASVYDAMARMAQDFSLRYPLIQGQGNWGSIDGDPPAAMRYTEARLSRIAGELLQDIEKETVDWNPNYDSSREEPSYLPAQLPHLLLNGVVGIAVGMATSIPPHNVSEVVDAIIYLASHPDASIDDLMQCIPAPDFPTGGVVYDHKALEEAYATGKGSLTMRGVAAIEERKSGSFQIVITEIPYQVNKSDLVTTMAELVQDKRIEGIRDIRDESDREGLRIVIELKNDAAPQKILNQLYQYTELQKNFYVNMLALVDGIQPKVLSLKEILTAYLEHRTTVVRRRTAFDLKKAEERAHILEGLMTALDAIDRVIATIKKSADRDEAKKALMKQFTLTELQANAILEMRLQTLAALERHKLEDELKEKHALIKELTAILKDTKRITSIIVHELGDVKKAYGGARKTRIVKTGVTEFKDEDLIPDEPALITLSDDGYIKRLPPDTFRAQRRGGKGLIGFELKEEDRIRHILHASTHHNALFFTDKGRAFQTKVYEIPVSSRTAKGKLVHSFLELPTTESVTAVVTYSNTDRGFLTMVTKRGVIKRTALEVFANVRRSGLIAIGLKGDDVLSWVKRSSGKDDIVFVTSGGQSLRCKESDVRPMGRGATGVTAIRLKKGDTVAGIDMVTKDMAHGNEMLLVVTGNGYGKQTKLREYKVQRRGGSGIRTAKVTPKTGPIVAAAIVYADTQEIIAFSSKGQVLRTKLDAIRSAGRATQGVRLMNLDDGDTVSAIVPL